MYSTNQDTHPFRLIYTKTREDWQRIWSTYPTEPEAISALQSLATMPDVTEAYVYDTNRRARIALRQIAK